MRVFRRPRIWIAVGVVLVALIALVLVALPPVARRIAVAQIGAAIGRDVTIGELRLNLFTRRLSLAGVRVADRWARRSPNSSGSTSSSACGRCCAAGSTSTRWR